VSEAVGGRVSSLSARVSQIAREWVSGCVCIVKFNPFFTGKHKCFIFAFISTVISFVISIASVSIVPIFLTAANALT
jgi:hypothetical protein